jgi:radical SAM superfamily enzyme YgiQ (UPF0313 family)
MRILCIHPWIYDFAAYNLWIEPLGLLTVAAALRAAGHEMALIDCLDRHHPDAPAPRTERDAYGCGPFLKTELPKPPVLAHVPRRWGRYGLPVEVFEAELDSQPRPDAVLVTSTMTYWYPGPFEAIRRVKARWPDVPVALGGIYATLCPDHARAHSGADAVLCGPGERTALTWVEEVTASVCHCEAHVFCADAISEPFPAHDLRRPQGYVAVLTAQGCPFSCPYCAVHQLCEKGWHPRPPEQVVDEIAWCVAELDTRDVAFYDDALLYRPEQHILPILNEIIQRKLAVRLHAPNGLHARYITRSLAELMRRAGFVTVRLGLESADPEQQARDGNKVDDVVFVRAVDALWGVGFAACDLGAYVLAGRPGQRVEDVRATAAFAQRLGIPVYLAQFSPIPGTVEWGRAVERGCLAADADPLLHNNSLYPCGDMEVWERLKGEIRAGNREIV